MLDAMRWFVFMAATALLAGCQEPVSTPTRPVPARTPVETVPAEASAPNQGVAVESVAGRLPRGFPIPLYVGTIVERGVRVESEPSLTFQVMFRTPSAGPVPIADFYTAELEKLGFRVQRELLGEPPRMVKLVAEKDRIDFSATISVIPPEGGSGGNLMFMPKPSKG